MAYSDPKVQRAYQRSWLARRRVAWLKANGPCARCGSKKNLEVDHVDAAGKIDHKVWSWSEARRKKELAKCQVLCRKCHVAKGLECGEHPRAQHGRYQMYVVHKCRCDLCRAWKSEDSRRYYKRKKLR